MSTCSAYTDRQSLDPPKHNTSHRRNLQQEQLAKQMKLTRAMTAVGNPATGSSSLTGAGPALNMNMNNSALAPAGFSAEELRQMGFAVQGHQGAQASHQYVRTPGGGFGGGGVSAEV